MATIRFRWTHRGYVAIGVVTVAIVAAIGFRGEQFDGAVVRIVDGDTFAIQAPSGEILIRIWGIDAPEHDQAYGIGAKMALGNLCMGNVVHLEVVDVDKYRRRVCKVTLQDGRDLGEEMVSKGCAWWSRKYALRNEKLKLLEGEAKLNKLGLWNHLPCIDPADWRARRRHQP